MTYEEFADQHIPEVKSEFLSNVCATARVLRPERMSYDILYSSLDFGESKQGYDFWRTVYSQLRNKTLSGAEFIDRYFAPPVADRLKRIYRQSRYRYAPFLERRFHYDMAPASILWDLHRRRTPEGIGYWERIANKLQEERRAR